MVKYRRYFVPGGTYFFTLALHNRKSNWLIKYVQELKDAMRSTQQIYPYETIAIVVLPDHLHVVWELPENDDNFSARWRYIKIQFAKNIRKLGVVIEKNRYGENILWQRRFWEHVICNEQDYEKHVDYIHYNPVKHSYVKRVADWPYSSFHRYVKEGILPMNWCYQNDDLDVE
jgi:putative transposase